MSPALNSVFYEPQDYSDLDVVLHFDEDLEHSGHVCATCRRRETPNQRLTPCTSCKAVFYCDVVCSNENWANSRRGQTGSHQDVCAILRRAHKKRPAMQTLAKQFPWVKQLEDGSVVFDKHRHSRGLFGCGPDYGWWTESPCTCDDEVDYMWGSQLLEEEHREQRRGWKLPDNEIPWLNFEDNKIQHPATPPNFEPTWTGYYGWRGLPMQSPAALLLHWPLSVYRLLHQLHCLPQGLPTERRRLIVHLLGVEKELDFLPIFGELALLIPNTDIELVMFGPGVFRVLMDAEDDEDCIAAQQYAYTYTAPDTCGGSTLKISLSDSGPIWGHHDMQIQESNRPNALIALNANLWASDHWQLAMLASRAYNIPFAVTECQEANIELGIKALRDLPQARKTIWLLVELTKQEEQRIQNTELKHFTSGMNPFMCPGPRPQALGGGPTTANGFELVITPGGPEEEPERIVQADGGVSLDDYFSHLNFVA